MLTWIVIMAVLVVVDQVTKLLALKLLQPVGSVSLIDNVFRFTYVKNPGAAFGMLSEHRWVFMIISTVAIVALIIYLWKFRPESRFACMALTMIAAGGIGNMIDRIFYGFVVDFVDFPLMWRLLFFDVSYVFNFADICVCVGGGMMVVWLVASIVKEYKLERKARATKKNKE